MAFASQVNQAWNRRRYDSCKSNDDLRLTSGPGRYQLDVPQQYCDATFAPEPTVRQQKWGASLNSQYAKTDVESDLFNITRPGTRIACGQYDPTKDAVGKASVVPPKEESFPTTHTRLVDPPCTLRSSGWNRWEWLCQNPQESVMMPFDNMVTTRLAQKDQFRPCIPKPINSDELLPAPDAFDKGVNYEGMEQGSLEKIKHAVQKSVESFPRGADELPAAPTNLYGIQPAPINPPSVAIDRRS